MHPFKKQTGAFFKQKNKIGKMPTTELVVLIGRDDKKKLVQLKLHSIRLIDADMIDLEAIKKNS